MAEKSKLSRKSICPLIAFTLLTSCSAPAQQAVRAREPSLNIRVPIELGKVASIRPFTFPAGQTAEIAGVNAVLTALGQEAVAPPVTGEEIVIQKTDGTPAALAQQSRLSSIQIGDRIMVIQGSPPTIIPRD